MATKKTPAKKKAPARKKAPAKKKAAKKKVTAAAAPKKRPRKPRRSRAKDAPPPDPVGRPSELTDDRVEEAYRLCLLFNATDADLAEYFGVTEQTINNWKKACPEFKDALRTGKTFADARVAEGLFKRATGFEKKGVYYPPETSAGRLWLSNRQSDHWRHISSRELSGPDGGPVPIASANVTVETKDAAEAAKRYKQFLDATD